jgi:hypothetical protein
MVRPIKVTDTDAPATLLDCNVTTMLISPLGLDVAENDDITEGVTPMAKKPAGYINVIEFVAERAPPALGVKPNVTGTSALFTTRSLFEMTNSTFVTAPPM